MLIPHLIGIAAAVVGQSSNLTYSTTYTDGLSHPARLAATAGGGLYVTDQPAAQVVELDAAGAAVNTYPIPEKPIGIAVHPLGDVFISRADGHVGRYDASFVLQEVLDPAPATLVAPNGLAVHSITGELYVVDSAEGQILVFADDVVTGWSLARAWGISGFGTAELMTPQALALDTALDLVIVADTDNFRGHVFDTAGMFVRRFGYRTSYVGMDSVAWVARTAGVAVDSCSNMYLSDALMGTVRVFDSMGVDLNLANPPIGYGANPGELRVPSGVLISGGKLYVASTYNATVEVFDLSCTSGGARDGGQPINALSDADLWPGEKKSRKRSLKSSGSSHVDRSAEIPGFSGGFDLNQDGSVDSADLLIAVETYGPIVVDEFLADAGASASHPSLAPPHIIDMPNRCGRCHSMHGLPSGMLTAAGQENLCLSCHTAAGVAMGMPIEGSDRASSHPWGVPASSVDVPGPAPGSELALHLDGGNIRCGTCHDPHETFEATDPPYYADLPYLRTTRRNIDLCGECHEEYGEWLQAGHAEEEAEAFVHYDWSLPNRAACRKCHSGNGYIDFSNDVPESERRGDFRVHDCLVCHATHGKAQSEGLLRIYGEVTLPTPGPDTTLTGMGAMATCMACHNGRYAPDDGKLTPHYLLAGVMLEGLNANDFGHTLNNSAHTVVGANCMNCHMAQGPAAGQPGHGKVGGHTFNISVHDPADPDYGVQNLNGCNAIFCHGGSGPLTTTNRPAFGDYDGDGTVEGVHDETQGLLDLVFAEIEAKGAVFLGHYPYWSLPQVCIGGLDDGLSCTVDADCDDLVAGDGAGTCGPTADDALLRAAIWNWEFVDNSGDLGVHNTAYAVGALQVTYLALTGGDVPGAFLRYTP